MRRFVAMLSLALLVVAAVPASITAAGPSKCSIAVTPTAGSQTDVYRITGTNFPLAPNGGSLEVRIDVKRLGTREGSILFLFLIPGATEFFVNLNEAPPGEPAEALAAGRYLVRAETAHLPGCHDVAHFVVE